jgi:mannose-1-phosphate guanylyltransferase
MKTAQPSAFKAVILAGGSGERFWPLSTPERPKQFLRVFGGDSLLRQSVRRLDGLVPPADIFVITAKELVAATRRELPEIPRANVIGEPCRRDTGAAVALATRLAGDAILGVFPSDQMVADTRRFRAAVTKAVRRAAARDTVVTLGIRPTFPSPAFGYIDPASGRFVEKPDARTAEGYIKKGYLWNAGMFLAHGDVFRAAFAAHAPALLPLCGSPADARAPGAAVLKRLYAELPRISFDFAVMEHLPRVEVVPGDFGWDDVGGYDAFDRYFPHDARGNVREGPCTVVEADDNICIARSARIALLGVKNLVVVTTPDAVLVADKSRVTELKKLFR